MTDMNNERTKIDTKHEIRNKETSRMIDEGGLGADYYYNIKRKDNVVSKKIDFNSEAVLKDFSTYIKQEMIEKAIDHKEYLEDDRDTVLKRINQLTEEELLALYLKHHNFNEEVIGKLTHSQDYKNPF
ncbi:MAG TPA: hypothetical protein VK108_08135, partial [Pseudogracilibacillus sp.]|nr:hypothetical protein [Pseudogracilibacillus sp.]